MSAQGVVSTVLASPETRRAGNVDEVASLVVEALALAGLLTETEALRCRSVTKASGQMERFIRCTLPLRHAELHSGQQNSTTTVTWTDEQAAGVLRERN